MAKINISFGSGTIALEKSTQYVGVKEKSNGKRSIFGVSSALDTTPNKFPSIGGFKIVSVESPTGKRGLMSEPLDALRAQDDVAVGTHVYYIEGSNKPLVPTGAIYISFADNVSEKQQLNILANKHLALKERRSPHKLVAQVTPQSVNPLKCAMALQALKSVVKAEPDIDMPMDHYEYAEPTARLWGNLWHLENKGTIADSPRERITPGADAKVVEAWKLLGGFGDPNIVIAVIDNGIDLAHPDFEDKIVKPLTLWEGSYAADLFNNPNYTHGTPCASVAAARDNGGVCGSAPVARLMPMSGTGYSIEITEQMFNYCIENGADIISCSWGTTDTNFALGEEKMAAIAKAAKEGRNGKGCVICYAAGNEGEETLNVYGLHPDVICVGASTSEDEHAVYSNKGDKLTICAPSNGGFVPIMASRASWDTDEPQYEDGIDRGPQHKHFGGTSSATPLVAGICALMLSANPNLTAKEVKQILMDTADKIGPAESYVDGYSVEFGHGRVNAAKAVQEAMNRR